ncbi:TPM domain-containing protein [Brucepastera parasyntrophica]|uniref:TPM domain-containing protein n=1 Tax=Brucepastera parasyntrophica TaxID=2880008 RepID=UPI00210D9297|nr:TPM domain-containing protein [Brucepastera parasyntrophica]ULQ60242.1 TPM domain-containing protein [Brucepastera parasyntrophica]
MNKNTGHITFRRTAAAVLILLLLPLTLSALDVPVMDGPVNDNARIMTSTERASLSAYLNELNDKTGIQIAVLTIDSLEGESLESFSIRVADKWALGQKGKDNGVLLLVCMEDRSLRIETGYGLEGDLTDAASDLIIRKVIVPYFKKGDYGEGIIAGVRNIVGIVTGDPDIVSDEVKNPQEENGGNPFITFILVILFIVIMSSGRGGGLFAFLFGSFLSSGKGGSSGRGHSGGGFSGGGGGRSGGGFSGGGGRFGGGGASGRW